MELNGVLNNSPGHATAFLTDSIPAQLEQTAVNPPKGSTGPQPVGVFSQLRQGNPGGIGQPEGIGITVDVPA